MDKIQLSNEQLIFNAWMEQYNVPENVASSLWNVAYQYGRISVLSELANADLPSISELPANSEVSGQQTSREATR